MFKSLKSIREASLTLYILDEKKEKFKSDWVTEKDQYESITDLFAQTHADVYKHVFKKVIM